MHAIPASTDDVDHDHRCRIGASLPRLIAAGVLLGLICGCGKTQIDRVAVAPVSGSVSFDGKPATGALIVLHPKGKSASAAPKARAQVEADGTFRFSTYDSGDGVPPGEYVATITWYQLTKQGGEVKAGPNVLPPKFANPKTSPWEVRVAETGATLPPLKLRR
jgi:hypothetical protein